MAKGIQYALNYYPADIGFSKDDKFLLIRDEFGPKCIWFILAIWDRIYGDKGYYYEWNEDRCRLLTQDVGIDGCDSTYVTELVKGCVRRSLFDKRVFDMFGILTSKSIQKRYFTAKRENIKKLCSKGQKYSVDQNIFLLDLYDLEDMKMTGCFNYDRKITISKILDDKSEIIENKSAIYDLKDSKEKESKVENNSERDLINVFELYEEGFKRPLTQLELQYLHDWLKVFDTDVLALVLDIALKNKAKSFSYINAVLNDWQAAGVKDTSSAQQRIKARQKGSKPKQAVAPLPDWYTGNENDEEENFSVEEVEKLKAELAKMWEEEKAKEQERKKIK